MKRFLLLNLILFVAMAVSGQSKLSPNTLHLVHSLGQSQVETAPADAPLNGFAVRRAEGGDYVNAYIYLSENPDAIAALESHGVIVNSVFTGIVTASIPVGKLEEVAGLDDVRYVQIGTPVQKTTDNARVATNAGKVQEGLGLSGAFRGSGVVVGVVDTGLEYGHPNFYNFDNTDLRLKRVWNQNGTAGDAPEGYSYGTEYKTKEEILNARYDNNETHGTHVTGIAAGADTTGNAFYGIAPDAEIVFVSMGTSGDDPDNINIIDGIKYIYDYASSVGKPCVVNLSLGMHIGPHDGTSTFDVLADQMQGKGRLLVGACGNEGSDRFHISGTFAGNAADSLSSFLTFPYGKGRQGWIDIWGEPGMKYTVQPYIYDRKQKTVKSYFDTFDASLPSGNEKDYTLKTGTDGLQGILSFVTEVSPLNEKPHASIMARLFSVNEDYAVGFTIRAQSAGTVHAWTENVYSQLTDNNIEGYTKGDSRFSVGEIGGTGKRIISVGAYSSKNRYEDYNGVTRHTSQKLNDITSFSSMGPTADGRMKPDVAAPGSALASSISNYDKNLNSEIIANKKEWNGKTYYYGMMEGTSMASPCVVGILATWLQANGQLAPEDIRSILEKTAIRDSFTGSQPAEESNQWGFGKINAYAGIKESLRLNPAGITSGNVPVVLFQTNGKSRLNLLFTVPVAGTVVSLFDMNGKTVFSEQVGQVEAGQELEVPVEGLAPGIYVAKVTGDQVAQTSKVVINQGH